MIKGQLLRGSTETSRRRPGSRACIAPRPTNARFKCQPDTSQAWSARQMQRPLPRLRPMRGCDPRATAWSRTLAWNAPASRSKPR